MTVTADVLEDVLGIVVGRGAGAAVHAASATAQRAATHTVGTCLTPRNLRLGSVITQHAKYCWQRANSGRTDSVVGTV